MKDQAYLLMHARRLQQAVPDKLLQHCPLLPRAGAAAAPLRDQRNAAVPALTCTRSGQQQKCAFHTSQGLPVVAGYHCASQA